MGGTVCPPLGCAGLPWNDADAPPKPLQRQGFEVKTSALVTMVIPCVTITELSHPDLHALEDPVLFLIVAKHRSTLLEDPASHSWWTGRLMPAVAEANLREVKPHGSTPYPDPSHSIGEMVNLKTQLTYLCKNHLNAVE